MTKFKLFLSIFLISLIILIFYIGIQNHIDINKFQLFIHNLGIIAPLLFIIIYSICPIFFVPITPLSITSGILFGPIWGSIISIIGANFGATLTFLLSRYLLKNWVDQSSSERVTIIQRKINEQGWKFVSISRLVPLFPFNLQNYIFGVTDIDLKSFFWASILGLIPGTFAFTYLGYLGKNAVSGDQNAIIKIIIPIGLIALISLIPCILNKFQRKII